MRTSGYSNRYAKVGTTNPNHPANEQTVDEIFLETVVKRSNNPALLANKQDILAQAFSNLGWSADKKVLPHEFSRLETELSDIVYIDGYLPSFFPRHSSSESKEENNTNDEMEPITSDLNRTEKYARLARNLLRHLIRGTAVCGVDGQAYTLSSLAQDQTLLDSLLKKRDPDLLFALRKAMQASLKRAFDALSSGQLTPDDIKQYEFSQSALLAAYPFMDPDFSEYLWVPQRIVANSTNGGVLSSWVLIPYEVTRLDLSPQSGPLSWVLEEEDRLYAYSLVVDQAAAVSLELPLEASKANSHLLLMGTTYPAGQGAGLADIYNYYPHHSVGEAHYLGEVHEWMAEQEARGIKVELEGHSKGGTLVQILTALYPQVVVKGTALNSTALSSSTYDRLSYEWDNLEQKRPLLQVIAQKGDPVYPLEKHFLKGTQIYRLIPNTDKPAMNFGTKGLFPLSLLPKAWVDLFKKTYEAHIHQFAGRASALFLRVNPDAEKASKRRDFFHDAKYIYTALRFPVLYWKLFFEIVARKIQRFYTKHKRFIQGLIIVAALAACAALTATGVLAPVAMLIAQPVLGLLSVSLTAELSLGITIGLGVVASLLTPFVLKTALRLISAALAVVDVTTVLASFAVAGIFSGLKLGLKSIAQALYACCTGGTPSIPQRQPDSNASSSIALTSSSSSARIVTELQSQAVEEKTTPNRQARYQKWKDENNEKMAILANQLRAMISIEISRLANSRGLRGFGPDGYDSDADEENAANPAAQDIATRWKALGEIGDEIGRKTATAYDEPNTSFADYQKQITAYLKEKTTEDPSGALSSLDKYSGSGTKFAINLFNVIWGFTVVLPVVKLCATRSLFFSDTGKSKETINEVYRVSRTAFVF
jgi:pimeloyl-ACP methyl ester carboxylesterase